MHRTTLHYRLDRVRELTGADLDDGATRLRLHLGSRSPGTCPDCSPGATGGPGLLAGTVVLHVTGHR